MVLQADLVRSLPPVGRLEADRRWEPSHVILETRSEGMSEYQVLRHTVTCEEFPLPQDVGRWELVIDEGAEEHFATAAGGAHVMCADDHLSVGTFRDRASQKALLHQHIDGSEPLSVYLGDYNQMYRRVCLRLVVPSMALGGDVDSCLFCLPKGNSMVYCSLCSVLGLLSLDAMQGEPAKIWVHKRLARLEPWWDSLGFEASSLAVTCARFEHRSMCELQP